MRKLLQLYQTVLDSKLHAVILISIICLSVHGVTIFNDYNLDDNLVTQNHRLTSKGISAIPEIYRSPYYQDEMGYSYGFRPTTLATFAIEKSLFGESPMVSHTVNLILYFVTCLLIYFLICRIFPDQIGLALGVALLFTVHPIHTEVVASIKNRDEILALLFALAGCFVLIKPKRWWINVVLASAFFFLSVSSKMSAVNLILLLAIIPAYPKPLFKDVVLLFLYGLSLHFVLDGRDVEFNNNARNIAVVIGLFLIIRLITADYLNRFAEHVGETVKKDRFIKIPYARSLILFIAFAVPFGLITVYVSKTQQRPVIESLEQFFQENSATVEVSYWSGAEIHSWKRPFDFVEHPLDPNAHYGLKYGTAAITLNNYLTKLFVPYPLAFYYGYNEVRIDNLLSFLALFSIVVHLLLVVVMFRYWRTNTALSLGIFAYLSSIILFSGAVEIVAGMFADRFSYTASFGFCIALVAGFIHLKNRSPSNMGAVVSSLFIVMFCSFSVYSFHRNTLWKNKLTLMRHDIEAVPNSAQAHNLLAHALMEDVFSDGVLSEKEKTGKATEAAHHFERATEIYPRFFNAWVDLGRVYMEVNQPQKAISAFEVALSEDSTYTPLLLDLAFLNEQLGNKERTIFYYRQHIETGTSPVEVYDALARILYELGRYQEAIKVCQQYLKIDPSNADFQRNILMMKGLLNDDPESRTESGPIK